MKRLLLTILISAISFCGTAVQMDFLMSGVMDSSGKPLNNGKVYFYENNGGTTARAVYTSGTMTSTMAQPIALNASGVPTSIPYGNGSYRVVWKTSAGVTIKTVTDVTYGVSGSSNYEIDVRTLYGSNDAAIASAIAAAGAANTTLLFQGGEFTVANNRVFPSNLVLRFANGAYWTVNNGIVATVSSNIDAPATAWIFRGTGTVVVSSANNPIVYSEWGGTAGNVYVQSVMTVTTVNATSLTATNISATTISATEVNAATLAAGSASATTLAVMSSYLFGNSTEDFSTTTGVTMAGEYWYRNLSINHTLTVGNGVVRWAVLRVNGTLYITANIDGAGRGATGSVGSDANPTVVLAGNNGITPAGSGGAGGGRAANGGGAGGGCLLATYEPGIMVAGGVGAGNTGLPGKKLGDAGYPLNYKYFNRGVIPAIGAGGGGSSTVGNGSQVNGASGGAGIIIVANRLVINGVPVFSCAGANGADSSQCGSGGGGGGTIAIYYGSLTGAIPALNVSGGVGGNGFSDQDGGAGGDGYATATKL